MVEFPAAKINLGLYVTDRRDDGYHNIETLFYPIGFSDILRQRNTDEISGPDVAEYSQMIYLSGRRLLDMVSDILDIISIDVSQNIIACEHIDISSKYTANVLNIIRARAASHQLSFSENLSDQKCNIYADPIRFKQIIYFTRYGNPST